MQVLILVIILQIAVSRRVQAEEHLDFKVMQYQESDGRVGVLSPTFLYKKEFSPDFSIQIDGIFNSISGATPTGAPPVPVYITTLRTIPGSGPSQAPAQTTILAPAPSYGREDEDEDEDEDEIDKFLRTGRKNNSYYIAKAGATPAAQPPPLPSSGSGSAPSATPGSGSGSRTVVIQEKTPAGSVIPTQRVEEQRYGMNFDVTRRINHNALSAKLSFSKERDYQSVGIALVDSIDMNDKNTLLTCGLAYTYDTIVLLDNSKEKKNSADLIIGVTQFISPKTIFTCNLSFGLINGFLSDQYKVVELNGEIVTEKRPDNKTKETLYLGLTHRVEALAGTAEAGYRLYHDSFDVMAHTLSFNWYQDLGKHFILRPSLRFYDQSESSFYDIRFTGTPEFFSSDYRISALNAYAGGLKLIWFPSKRFAFDIAYEIYEQKGKDSLTDSRMYSSANIITAGGRVWF